MEEKREDAKVQALSLICPCDKMVLPALAMKASRLPGKAELTELADQVQGFWPEHRQSPR